MPYVNLGRAGMQVSRLCLGMMTCGSRSRLLGKPFVTAPIIEASRLEHLDEAAAAPDVHLNPDEIPHLEECCQAHPILGRS